MQIPFSQKLYSIAIYRVNLSILYSEIAGISVRSPTMKSARTFDAANDARYQIRTSEVRSSIVGSNRYVLLGLECNKNVQTGREERQTRLSVGERAGGLNALKSH